MRFLHSVAIQNQTVAADTIFTDDLSVNPLSVILLCMRPLNETSTLSNFLQYLAICDAFNRITVSYRGEAVVNMTGRDAAVMAYMRHGTVPTQVNHAQTDNVRRIVVLPIFLGRFGYDPTSCFPPSRRGELILELDIDVADTGYDGFQFSVETIELLDAKPKEFERKAQIVQTLAATGDVDVDIAPGNKFRGLLLFGTTAYSGAAPAPTWGRVSTMLDNVQVQYSSSDIEVASMLHTLWGRTPPVMDGHTHMVPTNAGAFEVTTAPEAIGQGGWENYAFLDFDPSRDDLFTLDTRNASRFNVRAIAETANAVRVVPIEVIQV